MNNNKKIKIKNRIKLKNKKLKKKFLLQKMEK